MKGTIRTIKELCTFSSGNGFTRHDWSDHGLPIIRIAHLNGSRQFDYFAGKPKAEWIVEPGELLFAWAGTRGVSFGPTIWRGPRGVLNQHIYRVRPEDGVDGRWLYYALLEVTARIEKHAHGFKSSLLHVRKANIEDQRVSVPAAAIQRKIVARLGLVEDCVSGMDSLIESKLELKRGLVQQMLSGQKRFPKFRSRPWHTSSLDAHVEPVTRRNAHGCTLVLTASGEHGLVDQRRYFNRRVAGADLSQYYLLRRGEFAYNRSAMGGYPYGATKRLDDHDEGALSVLYLCFAISDPKLDSNFLRHVFESGVLNRQLRPIVRVGARAHGLLNVTDNDFLSISVPFPAIAEQRAIARVLDQLEDEIKMLIAQRENYTLYKRGLLTRLLSGELPVPS